MSAGAADRGRRGQRGLRALRGVRTRIFAYAVLLLLVGIAVSVFTVRQVLLVRLDARINDDLRQEVREFRSLADGVDPLTGRPFGPRLRPLFDLYLQRNVLADDEELLTFDSEGFYREKRFTEFDFQLSSRRDLVRRWSNLTVAESGDLETPEGQARYLAVPVVREPGEDGAFVVTIFTSGERDEIEEAVAVAGGVGVVVVLIGAVIAFLAAGRVLTPLRELTETARAIEETDLTLRIDVRGNDELAELGHTFNGMLDRLETAFSGQRQLVRDVSHELRTPITIIHGHLELLGNDPEERREAVELVTDELDRMGRLVEDLLILARAEQPDFVRREPVELRGFAAELLAKAQSLGERRWTLSVNTPGTIHADPQRLTQAVINLADNAVKQTTAGSAIEIGADMDGTEARLWVSDNGPGLTPEDRTEVFRRFARGASGGRYSGTGLGLSIVKAIAEAHGGRVEVESEPGRGARFTIVLPRDLRAEPREAPTEVLR